MSRYGGRKKRIADGHGYEGIPDGDMRLVADVLGPDAARLLMLRLPKTPIYIPQPVEFKRWYVKAHWTGDNVRELADALGVSHKTIYEYVKAMYSERRDDGPRQMALL